ncbi:hypothetical protein [Candidatus Nitrosotalea okcheonensis]|uniref:Uncharacterized protein n=1 Tax=Candidatus Nitrosotalea okcheonensis TaxID=1903276 RepID=A0A2H1FCI9_9ARCH|nr:hypothetical protein [Candidatus Nitrosotalea okcheonensis]MDE1841907.1 hypothetical protein [Nitrososphaerota archaeon]MDE1878191.1 hypothetical protein [Nitrososphaerota archaeon]SMH70478.1 conserved exported protein of unknown function [Candidatus Nitrosotalea okcheonensis]
MTKINKIIIPTILSLVIATVIFVSPISVKPAEAHIVKVYGNYIVEVGWDNEPAYTGLTNGAQVIIKQGSGDSATPVINALQNLQISVKYGSVTKPLDFLPSSVVDGQYHAILIPTRVGTYSLVLKGSVGNQTIADEILLDDVSSIDTLNFPQSAGSSSSTSVNMDQMGTVINQLTSDIEDAKNNADAASKSVSNVVQSFQQVKDTTDKLYMISMTGIGIGIAGIVIAVIAVTRNKQS